MNQTLVATLFAIATAFLYAVSKLLQMLEAEQMPDEDALKARLVVRLAQRPRWLAGLACDAAGYVTHAVALGLAAVLYVEPILASSLLIALLLGAVFMHRPVSRADWIAAIALTGGLAVFLYMVHPEGDRDTGSIGRWLAVGGAALVVIVVCTAIATRSTGSRRGALLGVAAGSAFGIAALLTKATIHYLGDGLAEPFTHWEPYALVVLAATAFLLGQSALQTGALGAAVGGIETMTVISGAIGGIVVLDERVSMSGPYEITAVILSAIAIIAGILKLASTEERLVTTNEVFVHLPGPAAG
jgi:drug/metabolite transporter (DMT)-like permease